MFTAILCVFLTYVGVKYLNEVIGKVSPGPDGLPTLLKIPLALVIGVGVAFLVAGSPFAHTEKFLDYPLDELNNNGVVIAGLLLGAAAVGFDTTLKTIRNVGENDAAGPSEVGYHPDPTELTEYDK